MSSEKQSPAVEGANREADVYDLLAWLEVNKKKVGIAAAVLVALGFLIATVRHFKRQKEERASAELLALKPTLVQPTNSPPPQAAGFLKVAENFSGTSAAERARILAATALFTEGRYADAEKEFSKFVQEFSNSPWTPTAAYGVAASQEAAGKANEAFASYQSVITGHANSAVVSDAKLALARIYENRKQPDQALRLYNELTAPLPGEQPGQGGNLQAENRKEALLRSHPNLNTNAMAPAPLAVAPMAPPATNSAASNAPAAAPATNAAAPTNALAK